VEKMHQREFEGREMVLTQEHTSKLAAVLNMGSLFSVKRTLKEAAEI
jgi:hypothetical protein